MVNDIADLTFVSNGCLQANGQKVPAVYCLDLIWNVQAASFRARLLDDTSCAETAIASAFSSDRRAISMLVPKALLTNTTLVANPNSFQFLAEIIVWKAGSNGNTSLTILDNAPSQTGGGFILGAWSSSSITAFTNMLKNIYQPVIQNGSGVNGNWDMSMIDGMMQIAVFTENSTLLSSARSFWLGRVPDLFYLQSVDGGNHAASPRGNPSWFGQTVFNSSTNNVGQETCRDLRHMEDSISSTILTAETDWIQGGGLYTNTSISARERIIGSMNVMAGLESQRNGGPDTQIPAPSGYCTSSGATHINEINVGPGTTYVIGYNEYHNRLNDPNMADSSGTSGLHGTANVYNWIQNGVLTQSLASDQGNHMTLFEALTHTVEVCQTATSAWTNTAFTAQTGSPTVKFNATPSGNNINTVVGLTNGPQSVYTSLAAIVRFNPSGFIDAYNGTGYSALTSIPYTGGTKYSFWFQLNIPAQTYNVFVTPEGGS